MNDSEAVRLATKLSAYFPGQGMGEASIAAYAAAIVDLESADTSEAVDRLILRSPKLPTVADIRAAYREVRQHTQSPLVLVGTARPALPGPRGPDMTFAEFYETLPPEKRETPGMLWLITLLEHYRVIDVTRKSQPEVEPE